MKDFFEKVDLEKFCSRREKNTPKTKKKQLKNYPVSKVLTQLAHIIWPPTARQRYAIQWRIAGGPLVARCFVLAGNTL